MPLSQQVSLLSQSLCAPVTSSFHSSLTFALTSPNTIVDLRSQRYITLLKKILLYTSHFIQECQVCHNNCCAFSGQFLFKNITQEKFFFSNKRTKATLFIHGNPNRRTVALFTLRRNMAMNATRFCWKIGHQGRDVLDGRYSDYLVPALRYSNMIELPPPPAL